MDILIDGGILAGGLSTRMLGRDKGLQSLNGQVMAKSVYQALLPHVNTLYINCNQNFDEYRTISPNVCSDTIEGYQGPLAGLVSLMEASSADYLLVSPCDTPYISEAFGLRMLEALRVALRNQTLLNETSTPLIFASKDANRHHPLHLLISTEYQLKLEQALQQGQNRVMQWVNNNHAQWIDFSDHTGEFSNFNTPEALSNSSSST
jgi:molybdopterin-guanine dinucleotide biosynthesis protein A